MADQGVRRRKNPSKANPTVSYPSSTGNGSSTEEKHRRAIGDQHSDDNGERPIVSGSNNSASPKKEYDEYAWFIIFLTALSYFIFTRGGNSNRGGLLSSLSKPYDVVASAVSVAHGDKGNEELLRSIFYIDKISPMESSALTLMPNYRLETILSSPPDVVGNSHDHDKECAYNGNNSQNPIPYISHIASTTWVHDEELGRGYLLLADAGRSGRIWRWEVGGGPITIGRSLHMERSGCRSHLWVDSEDGKEGNSNGICPENLFGDSSTDNEGQVPCSKTEQESSQPPLLGSASLAVELTRNAERASAGANIIVSEWGERRIVRVEGETGARTPYVTLVPTTQKEKDDNDDQQQQRRRVFQPNHLTYTPFGDLLFSDTVEGNQGDNSTSNQHVSVIYRRKEAVHIAPITAEESRAAHGWRSTTNEDDDVDDNIDILLEIDGLIEGLALGSDYSTLYVLVTTQQTATGPGWTKTLYKLHIGSDDEDEDDEEGDAAEATDEFTAIYNMTSSNCKGGNIDGDVQSSIGSKLTVDEKGILYMITCPSTLTLLSSKDGHLVGSLALDDLHTSQTTTLFTGIGFGEDGYLYITSPNELMRVKSRVGAMALPTDMVVPPPLKKPNDDAQSKQRRNKRDK